MSEPCISIIVPIYNCENYLDTTLTSLENQTYRNLEILLIDDGSLDLSFRLCQRYNYKDNRFKVFKKYNGGASSARNLGLDNATGMYILFVDADDYVSTNHVQSLYESLMEHGADICISTFIKVGLDKREHFMFKKTSVADYVCDSGQAIKGLIESRYYSWEICSKLYKRSIIQELRFDTNEVYGEDFTFAYRAIHRANKIAIHHEPTYYYIERANSLTKDTYNKNYLGLLITASKFEQFIFNYYPDLKVCSEFFKMHTNLVIISAIINLHKSNTSTGSSLSQNFENIERYIAYVKVNSNYLLKNTPLDFHPKQKLKMLLIKFSFKLFTKFV